MNELKVSEKMGELVGRVRVIKTDSKTGRVIQEGPWTKNLIVTGANTGKDLILKRLGGDNTYTLNILYADMGTSATAPTANDTQLGAAVARVGSPTITVSTNLLAFQFFWPDGGLANGTYNEIGTFIDGTSVVSTGQMFNHALFATPYVKASGEDTTVQIEFSYT